jgi:hypothetical protein
VGRSLITKLETLGEVIEMVIPNMGLYPLPEVTGKRYQKHK